MGKLTRARNALRTAICNMPLECSELIGIADNLGLLKVLRSQGGKGVVLDQLINENGLYNHCDVILMAISNANMSRDSEVMIAATEFFLANGNAIEDLPQGWQSPTSKTTRYAQLMDCIGKLNAPACLAVVHGLDRKGSHNILTKKLNRAIRVKGGPEPGVCLATLLESDYGFNSSMSPSMAESVQSLIANHIHAEAECVNAFDNFIL